MDVKNDPKVEEAKRTKQTNLRTQKWKGRDYVGVDLPWRESIEIVAQQARFFDQVLAMAGLPERGELPKILAVSQQHGIPSIWNRVGPSPLESNAAVLLTGLAFTNSKDWPRLIRTFFTSHNLSPVPWRGRPRLHPLDVMDVNRGIQIDKLIERLGTGFAIKAKAKRQGGFASGDEQTTRKLRELGLNDEEIKPILKSGTLQDAACRLFLVRLGEEGKHLDLRTLRNSYARYKTIRSNQNISDRA